MELLIMQSPPATFFFIGPTTLLSTLFLNTLHVCTSLSVRDQVPHPQETIGRILVLYTLIFKFLEKRQGDK
jgi:hypothetical protein